MILELNRKLFEPGKHAIPFDIVTFIHRVDLLRHLVKQRRGKLNKTLERRSQAQLNVIDIMLNNLDNALK